MTRPRTFPPLVLTLLLWCWFLPAGFSRRTAPPHGGIIRSAESRACAVFCSGPILEALQKAVLPQFGNDSKTFVDSPLLADPETVVEAFRALPSNPPSPVELADFARTYFGSVDSDLLAWQPPDWKPESPLVARARQQGGLLWRNFTLRNWTQSIHNLWPILGRKIAPVVAEKPQRHTLLPTKHPLIVPGGRFRESYYWDSYWIVRGLALSGMNNTAAGIVDNLLDFVSRYGFVPNGGRVYYLTRSQPPLLSEMVRSLFEANRLYSRSLSALRSRLPLLEIEHDFWVTHRSKYPPGGPKAARSLPLECDPEAVLTVLQHYDSNTTLPRPESWREDERLRESVPASSKSQVMRDVAAAAESGWDFSSRWFEDGQLMSTVQTSRIVPVELNSVLVRMERNICRLRAKLQDLDVETATGRMPDIEYCEKSSKRWQVMEKCMWNETTQRWNDLVVGRDAYVGQSLHTSASVSNWVPIWVAGDSPLSHSLDGEEEIFSYNMTRLVSAAKSLRHDSGLFQIGGLATTNVIPTTGQQWDWPNAWAPLQDWIIEGLSGCAKKPRASELDSKFFSSFARELGSRWLNSTLLAFQRTGFMFEKYDATTVGRGGGGGEYVPQVGFGWTNGVALQLLAGLAND